MNVTRSSESYTVQEIRSRDVFLVRLTYAEAQEILRLARCAAEHPSGYCWESARNMLIELARAMVDQGVSAGV